jgi:hypothetical protein
MISLKDLEKSVKKLQDVTSLEKSVEVNSVKVTYRTLDQEEEVFATEYVNNILQKFEELKWSLSGQAALGLSKRIAYLSYAIIEIDGIDLRDVEYIEDFDEEGNKVLLEKRDVIRNLIITNWDADFTMRLFQQWMAFAMESSVKLMEQVLIDYKSLEDQRDYHQKRYEDLQERIDALRGETAKEKLGLTDEEISSLEEGSESSGDPEKVILESSPQKDEEPKAVELDPEKVLNPKHPEEENWDDIQSSFIGDDDPNQALMMEVRRQEIIRREAQRKQKVENAPSSVPRLNRGLPKIPVRKSEVSKEPENKEGKKIESSLKPIQRGQRQRKGALPHSSNVREAFRTGEKIVCVEPPEYLDYPEEEMKKAEKPKPKSRTLTGGINPYYRDPKDLK